MKKIFHITACLLALAAAGCKKTPITQASNYATGTQIKFMHVAPGTPALDLQINNTRVSPYGIISLTDNQIPVSVNTGVLYASALTTGVFPGSNYLNVASGSTAIKVVASTPVPALKTTQTSAAGATIGTVTQNTADGSFYTVFAIGLPGSAAAPLGIKVVTDNYPTAADGKAYVRFANFIPNGPALDVSGTYTPSGSAAATASIVTNVAYTAVSDFIAVNTNPTGQTAYTFQAFSTGTTTKVGAATTAIALTPGRYYTVMARGLFADYVVPGTGITLKATARPTLPVTDPNTKAPEIYFNPVGLSYFTSK